MARYAYFVRENQLYDVDGDPSTETRLSIEDDLILWTAHTGRILWRYPVPEDKLIFWVDQNGLRPSDPPEYFNIPNPFWQPLIRVLIRRHNRSSRWEKDEITSEINEINGLQVPSTLKELDQAIGSLGSPRRVVKAVMQTRGEGELGELANQYRERYRLAMLQTSRVPLFEAIRLYVERAGQNFVIVWNYERSSWERTEDEVPMTGCGQ